MSFRPDGYRSEEDDGDFDFGDSSGPVEASKAPEKYEEPRDPSWPAKQLSGQRRGGSTRPPAKKYHQSSSYRNTRSPQECSSPEEDKPADLPRRRWRSRGSIEGRTGQWISRERSKLNAKEGEEVPDGEVEEDQDEQEEDGIIQYGDLEFFLQDLKLGHYIQLFRQRKVSFAKLLAITDADLVELEMTSLADRTVLLEGVKSLHLKKWNMPKTAIPADVSLGSKEIPAVLSHLESHIAYLEGTVVYVSRHIEDNPAIVNPSMECEETQKMIQYLSTCAGSIEKLRVSQHHLTKRIHRLSDYTPPPDVHKSPSVIRKRLPAVVCTVAAVAAVVGVSVGVAWWWRDQLPQWLAEKLPYLNNLNSN